MKSFALEVLEMLKPVIIARRPGTLISCLRSESISSREIQLKIMGEVVQLRAVDSRTASHQVSKVISGEKRGLDAVVALHGPPGTGKTSTLFQALTSGSNGGLLRRLLADNGAEDILLVYVSPTNQLVREAVLRIIRTYMQYMCSKGCTPRQAADHLVEILSAIRMYGSKVQPIQSIDDIAALNNELKRLESNIGPDKAREIRMAIEKLDARADRKVRLIFTTEWQDFVSKIKNTPAQRLLLSMFVDEASRSAYYKPFITARSYLQYLIDVIEGRNPSAHKMPLLDIQGFVVAGDVMQALTDPEEKGDLLLLQLEKMLTKEGHIDRALFLQYTKRLPMGTEEPVSHGFYEDKLKSVKTCKCVRSIVDRLTGEDIGSICRKLASRLELPEENICEKIIGALNEIYNRLDEAHCPLCVFKTPAFPPGVNIDENRAKLAALLTGVLVYALGEYEILVEAPYTELRDYTRWLLQRLSHSGEIGWLPGMVRVETVHAVLGGEADIVVSMLGKEWSTMEDKSSTLYFMQPEVLNVQLSRHRGLLFVIGDVERLERSARGRLQGAVSGSLRWASTLLVRTASKLRNKEMNVVVE